MPICYIMVGLPGVGKSTYIKNNIKDVIVHSSDQIIEEYAASIGSTYDDVFSTYIDTATDIFRQNIQDSMKNNQSFIVDRTNLTKKSRRAILSQLPKHYVKKAIVVEVNEVTHSEYLGNRKSKTIPANVIENFKNIFSFPTTDEGFDEIIHIKKE